MPKPQKREMTVNKTVSLPLSQVNLVADYAADENLDFSSATSKLLKLGMIYLRQMKEQEDNEIEKEAAKVLSAGKKASI